MTSLSSRTNFTGDLVYVLARCLAMNIIQAMYRRNTFVKNVDLSMASPRKMFGKRDEHREDRLYRRESRFTIASRRRISRNTLDRLSRSVASSDIFRSHRLLPCRIYRLHRAYYLFLVPVCRFYALRNVSCRASPSD